MRQLELLQGNNGTDAQWATTSAQVIKIANAISDVARTTHGSSILLNAQTIDAWDGADVTARVYVEPPLNGSPATPSSITSLVSAPPPGLTSGYLVTTQTTLVEMIEAYVRHALRIGALPRPNATAPLTFKTSWRYVLDNGPDTLFNNMRALVATYVDVYVAVNIQRRIVLIILLVLCCLAPIALTATLFLPSFRELKRDRAASLQLFFAIPKVVVQSVVTRLASYQRAKTEVVQDSGSLVGSVAGSRRRDIAPAPGDEMFAGDRWGSDATSRPTHPLKAVVTADDEAGGKSPVADESAVSPVADIRKKLTLKNPVVVDMEAEAAQEIRDTAVEEDDDDTVAEDSAGDMRTLNTLLGAHIFTLVLFSAVLVAIVTILYSANIGAAQQALRINYSGSRRSFTYR